MMKEENVDSEADLRLIERITAAFANVPHPGPDALTDSTYGEEPAALVEEFSTRDDWRALSPAFLDQAPDGWSTALAFFSGAALRFYLPAYLIADVRGELDRCDPAVRLCAFVTPQSEGQKIAQAFGGGTMGEHERRAFALFDPEQVGAIVAYLWRKLDRAPGDPMIEQALEYYWLERAGDAAPPDAAVDGPVWRNPDHANVVALLVAAGLPTRDLAPAMLDDFFACGEREHPDGVIGVELLGDSALLRSLVVRPSEQGHGYGRALVSAVEQHARDNGIASMYLLTETAERFFASLGYASCARDDAPGTIRATAEFSDLCPDSAVVMMKSLRGQGDV